MFILLTCGWPQRMILKGVMPFQSSFFFPRGDNPCFRLHTSASAPHSALPNADGNPAEIGIILFFKK
jgi:hypothetical protein